MPVPPTRRPFGDASRSRSGAMLRLMSMTSSSRQNVVCLQSKNHQNSWNSLVITPTTTVDCHSSCLYAGVDGIYFALKDHQQVPPHLIFARPRAKSYVTMKHDFKICDASIKVIPCHSSYLWIFEVSTLSPWVVEKWNGLDTKASLPNYEAYLEFFLQFFCKWK